MSGVSSTPAVVGRRACAALAAVSAGLHALMIGHAGSAVTAAILLTMLGVCLYCARDLWAGGSVRAWLMVALMNLGMIAAHWSAPGCHPEATLAPVAPPSPLMTTATSVAALEATIATAVLYAVARVRATRMALR